MAITHVITKTWSGQSGTPISKQVIFTAAEEINFSLSLPGSTTNQLEPLAFVKADLQSIFISSDQNITIKTNSSSSAQDVLIITAGDPFQWDINCGLPNPFAGNVTNAHFSNAGLTAANVEVRTLTNG